MNLRNSVLFVLAWLACLRAWRASVGGVGSVGGVLAWVACQRGLRGWRTSVGEVPAWVMWVAYMFTCVLFRFIGVISQITN